MPCGGCIPFQQPSKHVNRIVEVGLTVALLQYSQGSSKWQLVRCFKCLQIDEAPVKSFLVLGLVTKPMTSWFAVINVTYLIFSLWKTGFIRQSTLLHIGCLGSGAEASGLKDTWLVTDQLHWPIVTPCLHSNSHTSLFSLWTLSVPGNLLSARWHIPYVDMLISFSLV